MDFLRFYKSLQNKVIAFHFIWDFSKEVNKSGAIGGILSGEPNIKYGSAALDLQDKTNFLQLISRISAKINWQKEPIYLVLCKINFYGFWGHLLSRFVRIRKMSEKN